MSAKLCKYTYFYIHDHLGSTSMVLDADGNISQSVTYIPYGEIFVEERNGAWNSPYLFNSKELDEETGLYYYGARYLNPTSGMWLSTDPLFEKYVGMSPYNYCAGNPVMMVDVDGRELSVSVDGETFVYDPTIKENKYSGQNEIIGGFVSTLNKMNSTKIGNKLLRSLHKSGEKYKITNQMSSKSNTNSTIRSKEGVINKMGNSCKLLELSHELFHSFQYEKGQGGASVFNEIEAYVYSNRVVNEYNFSGDFIFSDEVNDSFISSSDFSYERPLRKGSEIYEKAAKSLVYDENFSKEAFNNAWSYFRAYSSINSDRLYYSKQYQFWLSTNKKYLISIFYK